jgi:hypothetical protein
MGSWMIRVKELILVRRQDGKWLLIVPGKVRASHLLSCSTLNSMRQQSEATKSLPQRFFVEELWFVSNGFTLNETQLLWVLTIISSSMNLHFHHRRTMNEMSGKWN